MKRFFTILIAAMMLLVVFSLTGCGGTESDGSADGTAAEEHFVFKLGHMRADGSPTDLDVEAFCEKVTELSGGTIEFEIYPASSLGDYTAMIERMGLGDVDMMLASVSTALEPKLNCSFAPYWATSWDEARYIFREDGVINTTISELTLENGFQVLNSYPMYFGGIGLSKAPTVDPATMGEQGLKIRIPGTETYEAMAAAFGFLSTPINYSDIFTSLQTGVIDGTIGGSAEGYYTEFRDMLTYYLAVNDHFEMQHLCISSMTWDKLSDNQKEILTSCAKEMEAQRWDSAEATQREYIQKLADSGITVVEFSAEELQAFAEKIRAAVEPMAREEMGDELYDAILADIEAMP